MEKKHGDWIIKETAKKYKDDFIELYVDQVIKPDKEPGTYATVHLKRGVAIAAINDDGTIFLTRQFRYALGRESIEVISGGIDEGEEPLAAAKREAKEELGIEADDWTDLGYFHLETSMINGPVYLFVAKNLHFTNTNPDGTEDIKKVNVSLEKAMQMVMKNEIVQGPSCLLILKAYLAEGKE